MPLFLYGITGGADIAFDGLLGIADRPVQAVRRDGVAAIVSDHPGSSVRAERRHIMAQQRVLKALYAQQVDLLPMAFGTLTPSADTIAKFLDNHHDELTTLLERVRGCVEIGLQVRFDVPDPIAYLVARSSELKAARDRAFGRRKPPSHQEKLQLGQMFEEVFTDFRETLKSRVVGGISGSAIEVKTLPVRDQQEIANLAVLVPRDDSSRFERAVETLAQEFDDEFVFRLSGPWPPHNFVALEIGEG